MTISARLPALVLGILICSALAPLLGATAALAADPARAALVIGNAVYRGEAPLINTRNDSADMARKLTALGFRVTEHQDLGRRDLARVLNDFVRQVRGSDGVALFYYSGHGLQMGGKNYLVPVDAQLGDELDVPSEAVPIDTLLAGLGQRGDNAVNLLILDACRNNPYQRSDRKAIGDKGLARVEAPSGTLILYATRPGETASDNPGGRNGLFTQHLLATLDQPGGQVEETFKQVARAVYTASGKAQSPWQEGVLFGQFYFAPPAVGPVAQAVPPPRPPPVAAGYLQVSVDAPGARISVDGRELGSAEPGVPLNLSNLPLGTVRVEASAPGRQRVERSVALPAGAWVQVLLNLPAAGPVAGDTWTEPKTGMAFVWVPGGSFQIGCGGAWAGDCYDNEKPARQVALTRQVALKGYWMAKTEVTQAQWQKVMGSNPSMMPRPRGWCAGALGAAAPWACAPLAAASTSPSSATATSVCVLPGLFSLNSFNSLPLESCVAA
nr:caspase family protein [uncultured Thiodictyon sp.]